MLAATIKSDGSMTVVVNNQPVHVPVDHVNYQFLLDAVRNEDTDSFEKYLYHQPESRLKRTLENLEGTKIAVDGDKVYCDGVEVPDNVASHFARRILGLQDRDLPVEPVCRFLENLLDNPSSRSLSEAPDFLENRNMPVTKDGCFLAYKTVRSDFYSKASGSLKLVQGKVDDSGHIYNGVGEVIECSRNEVDDERGNECSHGLHVGGLDYAGPGGWYNSANDKVVIVKVNPKDIVSVPRDHNAQKVRVCKYEVVKEYVNPMVDNYSKVKTTKEVYRINDPSDVKLYQRVKFDYPDRHNYGELETRYLFVESIDNNHETIGGHVLREDPSYVDGSDWRQFRMEDIMNIELLGSSPYEEEDDDDYDDEDDYDTYGAGYDDYLY